MTTTRAENFSLNTSTWIDLALIALLFLPVWFLPHGGDISLNVFPALSLQSQVQISGQVWQDYNGNGLLDDGAAAGLDGVVLRLYADDGDLNFEPGAGDVLVATTTTAGGGYYSIQATSPGAFWVVVDETTLTAGLKSVVGPSSQTSPALVVLLGVLDVDDVNFGYSPRGSVSGAVFFDYDMDSEQGLGDEGVPDVEVCVYSDGGLLGELDALDVLVGCTATDDQGNYVQGDLLQGYYLIVVNPEPGLGSLTPGILSVYIDPWMASGAHKGGNDYSLALNARVSGRIWVDSNGNGIRDPGETKCIANAPVTLTNFDTGDQVVVTSNSAGEYAAEVLPGSYEVAVPGQVVGFHLSSAAPLKLALDWGAVASEVNFGYVVPTAVVVEQFSAAYSVAGVEVQWKTRQESVQAGFVVLRSSTETGQFVQVSALIAASNDPHGSSYSWLDSTAAPGKSYWYVLEIRPDNTRIGPVALTPEPGGGDASRVFIPLILGRR